MIMPTEYTARLTARALERNRMSEPDLARALNCGRRSVRKLMEGELVRLDQEQYFNLYALAGIFEEARNA